MSHETSMLGVSSALVRHSALRQSILAQNIANADTPGFRARDVSAFTLESVAQRPTLGPRAAAETLFISGIASPDGNSVTLEDQMIRSADTRRAHDLGTTLFRKSIDLLRLGLGRTR
ncbi:flagellar basal body protein [Pontivivens insulae]|uniref:Flagellar basal body rod protein FlgB n=1 Tax=Pontivivens insulae TaxID=1639689 RepID=A0A2R8A9I0_9RHOB|nr:flagellar basal body protein [Pontivivens insulae]RED12765.1 flagellar basal-body rod protein FlgB [Pontivivens insulae]SPF28856.1 Flagellar basal body rod protein FlgB [Pontivivens insulae]